jgi:zona occludens toxin
MIQFLTGVIGSGKTYYAINFIVKNFAKDEELKKKIDKRFELEPLQRCLTNINELDIDSFNNVYSLNFKEFYENLKVGYTAYQDGATDTELNEIKEVEAINHSLIVLDECHNFLQKKDDVLVWWLSYARHMYMEVILISQDLALVDAKYKKFSEYFFKAQPSSLRIFNNYMRYSQYTDSTFYNTRKVGTIKVKIIPEIFELYGSGKNINNESFIKKFILLGVFLLLFMFLLIYGIRLYWSPTDNSENEPKKEVKVNSPAKKEKIIIPTKKEIKPLKVEQEMLVFYCDSTICIYEHNYYPVDYLFKVLSIVKNYKIIYKNKLDFNFIEYYILVPNSFKSKYLILNHQENNKKGANEENNNTFNSPFNIFNR